MDNTFSPIPTQKHVIASGIVGFCLSIPGLLLCIPNTLFTLTLILITSADRWNLASIWDFAPPFVLAGNIALGALVIFLIMLTLGFSIAALVLCAQAHRAAKAAPQQISAGGLYLAGKVISIVTLAISGVILTLAVLAFVL